MDTFCTLVYAITSNGYISDEKRQNFKSIKEAQKYYDQNKNKIVYAIIQYIDGKRRESKVLR
jgi:hypothetical protein